MIEMEYATNWTSGPLEFEIKLVFRKQRDISSTVKFIGMRFIRVVRSSSWLLKYAFAPDPIS